MKLKPALCALTPSRFREIREAYYKAAEGLNALATALEAADAELAHDTLTELIEEHLLVEQTLDVFDRSRLGRYL